MHVQFIVRDGTDRLLVYVPAFQRSFMTEINRFDPRAEDWLFVLVAATADGERLDLQIDDESQGEGSVAAAGLRLSIWAPEGLKASKKKLEIASAAKVIWNTDFVAARKDDGLEVSTKAQKAQPRELPPLAALVLR